MSNLSTIHLKSSSQYFLSRVLEINNRLNIHLVIHLPLVSPHLQHVVAFGRLVNFGMELLFGSGVAVGAVVAALAVGGFSPLVAVFHVGTRRRSILERLGTSPAIFVVVILRASVALPTQTRRTTALIRLVVGQHKRRALPLGVFG